MGRKSPTLLRTPCPLFAALRRGSTVNTNRLPSSWIAITLVILGSITSAVAENQRSVSKQEAQSLVKSALRGHDPKRRVEVEPVENRYDPFFIYFEATWPNPSGSPHLGNYAVNPVTA